MENLCVINDFDETSEGKNFQKLQVPDDLHEYSIFAGGNCFFIKNGKMTVRFHEWKAGTNISPDTMFAWIKKIKNLYPKF